jgi:hypothetical protein
VAIGVSALRNNVTGNFNTAVGHDALVANQVSGNTAVGFRAAYSNTTGESNTAVGYAALLANDAGSDNTAIGNGALYSNTGGINNVANGFQALYSNADGGNNTANGGGALGSNTTGSQNTADGLLALGLNSTGSNNVAIGYLAGYGVTGSGNVCIGEGVDGAAGENDTTRIRNVYDSVATGRAVYVDSDNKIGTLSSSRRYKEQIKPMDNASESLFVLQPVTFRYKKEIDPARALSFGLIAEDVARIDPDLIIRDEKGKPQTVRYEAVNAMLLNEFLKEHRKVEEQQVAITELKATVAQQHRDSERIAARQQNEIQALTAQLKEQAAQIQNVSAHIEMNRPAPRLAAHGK